MQTHVFDVVIVTMEKEDKIWGLDNDNGTTGAPTAIVLGVSEGKLTGSDEDLANCTWTVGLSDGNFTFTTTDTAGGKLYCTNSNNGIRVGNGENNTFKIDTDSGYLVNIGQSRYIGVYMTNPDWRCYTTIHDNIKGQTLRFWKYVEETVTPVTPITDEDVVIYGAETSSLPIAFVENGERLYRYDVRIANLSDGFKALGAQVFLSYDVDLLTVERIESDFDWTLLLAEDYLMLAWAGSEEVALVNDQLLFSVIFSAAPEAAGEEVVLPFVTNALNEPSAVTVLKDGDIVDIVAVTRDGKITFAEALLGDANNDGKVTSADAALVLRAVVRLSELDLQGALNADVDGDLEVTAADAALILQYVVGLIDAFPAA